MGALGPRRTFILWPSKYSGQLRLPSDLLGLNTVEYEIDVPADNKRIGAGRGVEKVEDPERGAAWLNELRNKRLTS